MIIERVIGREIRDGSFMRKQVFVFVMAALAAMGQEFEVVRINPAQPLNTQALLAGGAANVGVRVTGRQVNIGYASLLDLATRAYEMTPFDVTAPDWMKQQRYDVQALMPEGATEAQLPKMLQAMLRDRFKMVVHKESKEQQVYGMEVAKGGVKMKEAAPVEAAPPAPVESEAPAAAPAKPGERSLNIAGQQMKINPVGGGGATISVAGGANGAQKISVTPEGQMHFEIERMTMPQLAEQLNMLVDLPVVDKTGLPGAYQVTLDMTQADLMGMMAKLTALSGTALPPEWRAVAHPVG